ncbi:MAG TPA: VWA domain-containing protein [Vicinamibacterales bacterium]|nr:VWA domain-containing protein [Vicinamibacterales bacterium]
MKCGIALAAAVFVAGAALLTAQQPTFRVSVDAIELDAFVTDAQGSPVRGLTVDDFQILEDGKPQVITSFSQVDIPFERRTEPLEGKGAIESDVGTNNRSDGRVYLFILDEVSAADALRSRVFFRRFLQQHFAANDRGAVVFLGHQDPHAAQPFTGNPRLLLAAFDRFTGGFPSEETFGQSVLGDDNTLSVAAAARRVENSKNARQAQATIAGLDTMVGLESAVKMMAGLHGRRKAVLLFSSGLPEAIFRALSYEGGAMSRAEAVAHAAVTAATRGNVTIYPIDPAGLVTSTLDGGTLEPADPATAGIDNAPTDRRMSLSMLADATGGFSLVGSNNFTTAFDRIVRENSTYYVLGFTSSNEKRDGLHRSLRVRVMRPGLQVRAREGYVAPLKNERLPEPSHVASVSAPLSKALTNPLSEGAVPIRVVAAPYRTADKNALVAVAAEVDPTALGLIERDGKFNGQLEVGFLATDVLGKVYQGQHYVADLAMSRKTYDIAREQGIRVMSEIRLPPGRYQLRLAAGNPSGKAGSVAYDLTVPDFSKDPLTLSGLVLTSDATKAGSTIAPKDPLVRLLPRPATARRSFDTGDTLVVFGEVYDNAAGNGRSATNVRAELRDETGAVVRTDGSAGNRFALELPLERLESGAYVVHVEATATLGKPRSASRDIPVRVIAR